MPYSDKWIVNKPFTILEKDPLAGELCCPVLFALPCGDLLIGYVEGDFIFSESKLLRSSDGGLVWNSDKAPLAGCCGSFINIGPLVRCYDHYAFLVKGSNPAKFVFRYRDSLDGGKTFGSEKLGFYEHNGLRGSRISDIPGKHIRIENMSYWENVLEAAGWKKDESNSVEFVITNPYPNTYLEMPDGSLLNISYLSCSRNVSGKSYMYDLIASISTDGGVNWKYLSYLNPPHSEAVEGYAEGSIALLKDQTIYVVMRHGGGGWPMMLTVSKDFGRSWSELQPIDNKVRGIFPTLTKLADGALAMSYGRPGMHLMFSPDGCGDDWEVDQRIDIWDHELLTLKTNAKPVTSRTDIKNYKTVITVPIEDMPWMRQDLLSGYFCSWENVCFREVSPGKILFVYDLQNFIDHPDAAPKKAIRALWITKT